MDDGESQVLETRAPEEPHRYQCRTIFIANYYLVQYFVLAKK